MNNNILSSPIICKKQIGSQDTKHIKNHLIIRWQTIKCAKKL